MSTPLSHHNPPKDQKGRTVPEAMADREMLIELITSTRQLGDALESLASNPMVKAMAPKGLF